MSDQTYGKTALIDDITANTQGITRKTVETVVNSLLDTIQAKVASGQRVTLTGFGTWQQTHRQARTGMNIRTKQKIQIPAQTSVNFKPGSELKAAVSGKGGSYAKERAAGSSATRPRGRTVPQR